MKRNKKYPHEIELYWERSGVDGDWFVSAPRAPRRPPGAARYVPTTVSICKFVPFVICHVAADIQSNIFCSRLRSEPGINLLKLNIIVLFIFLSLFPRRGNDSGARDAPVKCHNQTECLIKKLY